MPCDKALADHVSRRACANDPVLEVGVAVKLAVPAAPLDVSVRWWRVEDGSPRLFWIGVLILFTEGWERDVHVIDIFASPVGAICDHGWSIFGTLINLDNYPPTR